MNRFIVLGHTGFVGRRVLEALRGQPAEVLGFSSATLDLRSPDALRRLDAVIDHETTVVFAAALTPDMGATLDVLQDNLDIVMNVARYFEDHPPQRCVYLGTDAVYPAQSSVISEESPIEPATLNALAKHTGERVLEHVAGTRGMRLLILRLTPVYGFGDTHGSYGPNLFMRTLLKDGIVTLFGDGAERRDHINVDDVARAIVELVRIDAVGTFNLATGTSVSFAEIVEMLRAVAREPFEVRTVPRKIPVTHRHFDATKILLALPHFRFTALEDGLARYYATARMSAV